MRLLVGLAHTRLVLATWWEVTRWRHLCMVLEHALTRWVLIFALVVWFGCPMVHFDVLTLSMLLLLGYMVLFARAKVAWDDNYVVDSRSRLELIVV